MNNNFREDYQEYREYLMHSMPSSARDAQRRQEERDRLMSRHNPPSNPGLAQTNPNPMEVISSTFHNRSRRRR